MTVEGLPAVHGFAARPTQKTQFGDWMYDVQRKEPYHRRVTAYRIEGQATADFIEAIRELVHPQSWLCSFGINCGRAVKTWLTERGPGVAVHGTKRAYVRYQATPRGDAIV